MGVTGIILSNSNMGLIIGLAVTFAILAIIIFILLFKFVFIRKRYAKQVTALERKYSYLHALMIGQDSQYIRRLEMISRTNLLYLDIYNEFYKKYKDIYEVEDKFAGGAVTQLKRLIEDKQYRNISRVINKTREDIAGFEAKAIALDSELTKLIKPEEDSRACAVKLKENLRGVKATYELSEKDLRLVNESIEKVFHKLDQKFDEFETHIEGAEYDEANAILPVIDKVITQMSETIRILPKLCILVTNILPDKLETLKHEAEHLQANNYPLYHLLLTNFMNNITSRIDNLKMKLINLDTNNVAEAANKIQDDIEGMHDNFVAEIDAKSYFEQNADIIYQKVLNLEKSFLRIVSLLPDMNRVYLIDEHETQRFEDLKDGINRLGGSKRSLDTYVNSSTQQAYSVLREKLEQLNKDYEEVNAGVNNFKVFVESLKANTEEAFQLVFAYYYRLKQCEQQISSFGIEKYAEKFSQSIEDCYDLLNEIDILVKKKPIDVGTLNVKVEELKNKANQLFDSVDKDNTSLQLAESSIVYANRDRHHQGDVHKQLLIAEHQFYEGEFQKTYVDVINLLKRSHVEDSQQ